MLFENSVSNENISDERTVLNYNLNILGSILKTREDKHFYAFRGIAYAKPPIGDRRFKDPVPIEAWNEILDATNDVSACLQPKDIQDTALDDVPHLKITEDCLKLNVYTSSMVGNKSVIVFIHGGGLRYGTGNSLHIQPEYFLNEDIVLVTFNYRLGPFGFVSSGTKDATGNYGFKDQVLVLKWVRDNIHHFGGNPNSVTLVGHSAGSMSVTLHMVSPMSKNLFHRIIALSGSTTNQWRVDNVNLTKTLAKSVQCPYDNGGEMIDCLREKPWEQIIAIAGNWDENYLPDMEWNYEIEQDFGQERFIIENPTVLFEKGEFNRVSVIAGITKDEYKDKGYFITLNEHFLNNINDDFYNLAPQIFGYGISENDKTLSISKRLKELYFNDKKIGISTETEFGELFSDALINFGVHRFVQLTSQYIDVYYYRFDYKGRYTCSYYKNGEPGYIHHDDLLIYLFNYKNCAPKFNQTTPEYIVAKKFIQYLVNFSRSGDPNVNTMNNNELMCSIDWLPSVKNNIKTLYIDENLCKIDVPPYEDRFTIWNELFPTGVDN
ncbi:juvenile hormone esterase-like [Condylostylus longicornis]|uniref:juvenile hormone esterase-like n=1 Tax=Condylostylus longicornis TaxID=2530218 RepID=UPI00244DDF23|nr:juvenile hormone esterase-like [Condylostylus longicornis]